MSFKNEDINEEDFIRSLKSSGGFETPKDYFDNNLEKLQQIPKEPSFELNKTIGGFEIPSLYFENLNEQILSKVIQPKKGEKLNLFTQVNWMNYAAACLVFGLIVLGVMKMNPSTQTETATLEDLTEDEIIEHLSSSGYREEMLCDAGWCDELKKLENNSEIENYLLDDGSELELTEEING